MGFKVIGFLLGYLLGSPTIEIRQNDDDYRRQEKRSKKPSKGEVSNKPFSPRNEMREMFL